MLINIAEQLLKKCLPVTKTVQFQRNLISYKEL